MNEEGREDRQVESMCQHKRKDSELTYDLVDPCQATHRWTIRATFLSVEPVIQVQVSGVIRGLSRLCIGTKAKVPRSVMRSVSVGYEHPSARMRYMKVVGK